MLETYVITENDGITTIKFLENPSFDIVKLIIDELAKNHSYEKRLWDMSEINFDFTTQEIKDIAAYGKQKFSNKNKMAIYTLTDLSFGEMRQFEIYREEKNKASSAVFRDKNSAIDWLNS